MHTIYHQHIQATINPLGAELSSLMLNNVEYLWQGDERYWTGRAPILFPVVGALKDGHMIYQGRRYAMGKHGIVRQALFDGVSESSSAVTMRLQSDHLTLEHYPWQFELLVHFTLDDSGLQVRYEVTNKDDTTMLFTLGSHPAFALAVNEAQELSDYTISIEQNESLKRYRLFESGLLDTSATPHDSTFCLSATLFNDDALVFRDIKADSVALSHKGQTMLRVKTGGAPHLGIWAKPGAPFVCIEPWLGTCDFVDSDNQFEHKPDLTALEPGKMFNHGIDIIFPDGAGVFG